MHIKRMLRLVSPLAALLATMLVDRLVPDRGFSYGTTYWLPTLLGVAVFYGVLALISLKKQRLQARMVHRAPLWAVVFLVICLLDVLTAKTAVLPLPYFPAPGQIFDVIVTDWRMLLKSAAYSLRMLGVGYLIGGSVGLVTGVLTGWSKRWSYWLAPLQKVIGPIPATAWIPIAMTIFPTSFTASTFILALSVWFPVTVMTGSGIANTRRAYFEVAQTLGADKKYLVFRVAVPAALPNIFIGLFMGLGMSFVTLVTAEMLGVKAGLGWYIQWAEGWAEYRKVYASLVLMALIFSTIITLLFKIRDKVLVWQKGLIKW